MMMIIIIFSINVVYVSFFTIRMILTLKGQKYLAAAISSIEVLIYVIGLGLVLDNLNEIQNLIAYAMGYAMGVLVGSKIEEKLALGYVTVKVITNRFDLAFSKLLRDQGYGVTSWMGEGRDGKRLMMEILTRRKAQEELYNLIVAYDPKAFIISHEPRHFHGGFWVKGLKKHAQEHGIEDHVVHEDHLPGVSEESIQEILEQTEEISELAQGRAEHNINEGKINIEDSETDERNQNK